MSSRADGEEVAAALDVGMETGLFSMHDVVRIVDREIEAKQAPARWMIESSMAQDPGELRQVLRAAAKHHPLLSDTWARLEAMALALDKGVDVMAVADKIRAIYPYGTWPAELSNALYDTYEELTCAHERGGVPHPDSVEKALRRLLALANGKSEWASLLRSMTL
jgi:hypothetical protein